MIFNLQPYMVNGQERDKSERQTYGSIDRYARYGETLRDDHPSGHVTSPPQDEVMARVRCEGTIITPRQIIKPDIGAIRTQ